MSKSEKKNEVVALLVRKNSFENEYDQKQNKSKLMLREQVLNVIFKRIPNNSIVISTTGILSRELNELIKKNNFKIRNFMCGRNGTLYLSLKE